MKKLAVAVLSVVLLCFMGCENKKQSNNNQAPTPQTQAVQAQPANSNKAPDFSLIDITGKKVNLSDYKGNIVILDFWASWCGWCKIEIPFFIDMYKKYNSKGLVIIGVATSDRQNNVENFVSSNHMNYPVVMASDEIVSAYGGIRGLPTTFVIDKEGNIARQYVGYRPREVFEKDFSDLSK